MSPSLPDRLLRTAGRRLLRAHPRVLRRLAGPEIRNLRGDPLDAAVQLMLRLQGRAAPELGAPTVEEARYDFERGVYLVSPDPEPLHVEAGTVEGAEGPLRCLTYRPPRSLGTLMFLHGGGWCVGSIEGYDPVCRQLALLGRCTVVSVDYRLGPEHPFPAGLNDALAAYDDLRERTEGLLGIGGDSAGGNLSAVVARHRDPDLQLLVYPCCDQRRLTASYHELKHGFILEDEAILRYLEWYGADPEHPDASPVLGAPGRARAIVATAGFDPLRDEGETYTRMLRDAGVPTVDLRFSHLVHGFFNMGGLVPAADAALRQIGHVLHHSWLPSG